MARNLFAEEERRDDPPAPTPDVASQSAEPEERGIAVRMSSQSASGLYEGMAELLGVPVDLVAAGLSAAGVDFGDESEIFLSSAHIKTFLGSVGLIGPDAEGMAENAVRRVSTEIGAAIVPIGTIAGLASKGVRVAPRAVNLDRGFIGRRAENVRNYPADLARGILERPTQKPRTFVAEELAGAAGAGGGAVAARQLVEPLTSDPNLEQTAEFGGAIAGGLAPTTLLSATTGGLRAGGRALKALAVGTSEDEVATLARDRAADMIRERLPDINRSRSRIDRGEELSRELPGFRPTSAQSVNEPGLVGLEARIARGSPELADRIDQARIGNNQALTDYMSAAAPQGNPAHVRSALADRAEAVNAHLQQRIAAVQEKIQDAVARANSPEEASRIAGTHLREAAKEFNIQSRVLYDAVDPEGVVRFATQEIKAAGRVAASGPRTEDPTDIPAGIVAAIEELRGTESFTELRSLRRRVNHAIREEEAATAPNRNRLRKLNGIRDATQSTLDSLAQNEQFADAAARYARANTFFAQGSPIFRRGNVGRVLRRGPSSPPETATLDYFINAKRGSRETAQQFADAVGGRAEAVEAVRDYTLNRLFQQATDINGRVDPRKLARFVERHAEALRPFPEVRADLQNMTRLQQRVDTLAGRQQRVAGVMQRKTASLFLGDDPQGAVRSVINSPRAKAEAQHMWRLVKNNPDAQQGLRRSLWDEFTFRSESPEIDALGSPFANPRSMRSFVNRHETVFRQWGYSEKDMANLRQMTEAADMASRTRPPSTVEPREVKSAASVFSLNQLLSRFYGVARGVVSARFVSSELGARFFDRIISNLTEAQVAQVLEDALASPRFLQDLLDTSRSGASGMAAARRARVHLISTGILQARGDEGGMIP